METLDLRLTGIANGGNAVGRHNGRAIFVRGGIPGESARVHIVEDKKHFAIAEIVEVLEASEYRVQPRCPHFGVCGGCHWQHMTYEAQLRFKRQIVAEQLKRIGSFQDISVQPTIPSPNPWNYRSHATFHLTKDNRLGFVGIDNHSVIPIDECHIIQPELLNLMFLADTETISSNKRWRIQTGNYGNAIMFASADEEVTNVPHDGHQAVYYTIKEYRFRCSAGSFFQVNLPQAEVVINKILSYLELDGTENILELYSGVGLFTAFLAAQVRSVLAIEISSQAVEDARFNLAQFRNVTLLAGKVEQVLGRRSRNGYDAAVLDPPRSGIDMPALKKLVECRPQKIVYVSCDVATLARDGKRLAEVGYKLIEVQPVDMFPQTHHIECVALFSR